MRYMIIALVLCAACSTSTPPAPAPPPAPQAVVPEWTDTPAGKALRMGAGPNGPAVRSTANPSYPDIDRQSRRQGKVRIEAVIDETGRVVHTEVLEAPSPSLGASAADAVSKWRFAVTSVDGRPVRVVMPVEMQFRLP